MTASRSKSVSSARSSKAPGRAVSAEPLEGRRLFNGFAPRQADYAPPVEYVVVMEMARHGPPAESWQNAPFGGGRMRITSDGNSVTASSANSAVDPTSAGPAPTAAVGAVTSATPTAPVAVENAKPRTVMATPSNDVVGQLMNDTQTAGASANARAAVTGATITAAGAAFGPFFVKPSNADVTQSPMAGTVESGLEHLLALNTARNARLAAWANESAPRARRGDSADQNADPDDAALPAVSVDALVQQAALPMIPGDASMRPVWQRVALFAAGGVIVAANWLVRRRQRQVTAAVARR